MGRPALLLALVLLLLAAAGTAAGSTQAPSFARADYAQLGSNHIAADFNGDGRLDLAVTINDPETSLSLLAGNGDGTFQPTREVHVGRGMTRIAVGDLNRDGVKDLAIAGDSSRVYRLLGVGDGTCLQQPTITLTADTFAVDACEFAAPLVLDRTVTASQFTAPTLAARRHWWRVRGINSAGTAGAWSSVRRFVPQASSSPPAPAQTATLTVTATGRSGERVTSNPAGINVAVGSTGSAPFATGTAITLSATNGRDVIWSGACSSGGNKQRTCTFTLGGTSSVTANVQ